MIQLGIRILRHAFTAGALIGLMPWGAAADPSEPAGRVGRAIVVALTPTVTARYPDRTAHDFPQGQFELREGIALSELHKVESDRHGRACMVLTPGAILCVRPETSLMLDRLQQMTQGLPESGKDLQRRIECTMAKGGLLVHAGPASSNLFIEIRLPFGVLTAHGGEFLMLQEKSAWLVGCSRDRVTVTMADGRQVVEAGKLLEVRRDGDGKYTMRFLEESVSLYREKFDMCVEFLPELGRIVFLPYGADTGKLQAWMGTPGGIVPVGDPVEWTDVTPSRRLVPSGDLKRTPGVQGRPDASGQWGVDRIWQWYRNAGVIKGVNYIPRTAVNSLEFWQEQSFDTNAIDEELDWAGDAGFNSVRVMLSFAVWSSDPKGFKDRMRRLLELAKDHQLTVVPVLFDDLDVAGRLPVLGAQPEPVPGVHNSQWVPNPGRSVIENPGRWHELEKYVRDITGTFYRDRRVLFWDLYNVPGSGGMGEKSLKLLESAFGWARASRVRQPVTALAWGEMHNPISARLMEMSDLITFQSLGDPVLLEMRLRSCEAYGRPVICSDWLNRKKGGTFEAVLPILAGKRVGWYSRGLVKGRAQFYIPDDERLRAGEEPKVWQQDVLWPDGKPYERREIDAIRAFTFDRGE